LGKIILIQSVSNYFSLYLLLIFQSLACLQHSKA